MSLETERSSTGWEYSSGLDYEDTALTLAPPGTGGSSVSESEHRKRGFLATAASSSSSAPSGQDSSGESPDVSPGAVNGGERPPSPKARVVGWPPVRNYRKNVLKSCKYVKVAVDGAPYLRKVDLEAYHGYQQLLVALQEMFSCFTIRDYANEETKLVDPVSGLEYVPTYEDKDGDWMLVGDVPWKMFVDSCRRIRVMKSSEAVNFGKNDKKKRSSTQVPLLLSSPVRSTEAIALNWMQLSNGSATKAFLLQ